LYREAQARITHGSGVIGTLNADAIAGTMVTGRDHLIRALDGWNLATTDSSIMKVTGKVTAVDSITITNGTETVAGTKIVTAITMEARTTTTTKTTTKITIVKRHDATCCRLLAAACERTEIHLC
jgi:hypothetical protein